MQTWANPNVVSITVGKPETIIGIVSVWLSMIGSLPVQLKVWALEFHVVKHRMMASSNFFIKFQVDLLYWAQIPAMDKLVNILKNGKLIF